MKTVIIEDEALTAEDLRISLERLDADLEVVKVLGSVSEAVAYFKSHPEPDLIFSDIELGDGKCFEIFRQVDMHVPVVFVTAYDHYALEAFRSNGIDYVLKPFHEDALRHAVDKWSGLRKAMMPDMARLMETLKEVRPELTPATTSVLVSWKDRIIPLKVGDIAFIGVEAGYTYLVTMDNRRFPLQESLEEYMKRFGTGFYRVNRQYLVNREAVTEAVHHTHRKLLVRIKPDAGMEITLSKARVPEFLHWLEA
jgi:two-component system response regulator LytT